MYWTMSAPNALVSGDSCFADANADILSSFVAITENTALRTIANRLIRIEVLTKTSRKLTCLLGVESLLDVWQQVLHVTLLV